MNKIIQKEPEVEKVKKVEKPDFTDFCVNCGNGIVLSNFWEHCDNCNYFNKKNLKK
jgi:ribosomal protein S27AE